MKVNYETSVKLRIVPTEPELFDTIMSNIMMTYYNNTLRLLRTTYKIGVCV